MSNCLLKICLISKKYVSLHPIFVSCLIFKRENYGKKIDHAHGRARSFNRNAKKTLGYSSDEELIAHMDI